MKQSLVILSSYRGQLDGDDSPECIDKVFVWKGVLYFSG